MVMAVTGLSIKASRAVLRHGAGVQWFRYVTEMPAQLSAGCAIYSTKDMNLTIVDSIQSSRSSQSSGNAVSAGCASDTWVKPTQALGLRSLFQRGELCDRDLPGGLGLPVALVLLAADLKAQDGPAFTPSYPIGAMSGAGPRGRRRANDGRELSPAAWSGCPRRSRRQTARQRTWKDVWLSWRSNCAICQAGRDASDGPTKPLIVPSGRIQFDAVMDFTQNAASNYAVQRNAPKSVRFRRARLRCVG